MTRNTSQKLVDSSIAIEGFHCQYRDRTSTL